MNEWRLIIKKVGNGYILRGHFGDSDFETEVVHEVMEGEDAEIDTMELVLWDVIEYFGMCGSKHDKRRLRVRIEETKDEV